ncbi:MAG: hypothetical protein E5W17_01235, partial [Mesorhizobium sp.]
MPLLLGMSRRGLGLTRVFSGRQIAAARLSFRRGLPTSARALLLLELEPGETIVHFVAHALAVLLETRLLSVWERVPHLIQCLVHTRHLLPHFQRCLRHFGSSYQPGQFFHAGMGQERRGPPRSSAIFGDASSRLLACPARMNLEDSVADRLGCSQGLAGDASRPHHGGRLLPHDGDHSA